MKDLYDARERQQNLSKVLQSHEQELDNIIQILNVVKQEPVLQVATMMEDLEQLKLHGRSLRTCLEEYGKDRGQFKQYANQLFNGKRNIDDLAAIMASMSHAKANLNIKIQVVHVGLTRCVGDGVVVSCELVESLDRKLQRLFGEGKGLKLAQLLRNKQPDSKLTRFLAIFNILSGYFERQVWANPCYYRHRRRHGILKGRRHCLPQ